MTRARLATGTAVLLSVAACGEPPTRPETPGLLFERGGAGRPVVVVNPHAPANAAVPTTIQEGVNLVGAGGTVMVLPGTYAESLVITKGLTIEPVGNGSFSLSSPPEAARAITVRATDPVVLRGFTVAPQNVAGFGVQAFGSTDVTVEELTVEGGTEGVASFNSIASSPRSHLIVRNSSFDGQFAPGSSLAVFVAGGVDASVTGNRVRNYRFACVQFQSGRGDPGGDMTGNDVDNCGQQGGLRVFGNSNPALAIRVDVIGNIIRNSSRSGSRWGIVTIGNAGRIEHNSIVDFVQPSATAFLGFSPAAILLRVLPIGAASAVPTIHFNDIQGNAQAGIRNYTSQTVDATCNWWGAADGPSGLGPGSGDAVAGPGPVSFTPFATAPVAAGAGGTCS